jgi:hypothetical protein
MRIRFTDTYNFTPVEDRRITTKYRKNMEITCRRIDGMIAVANGAAVEIEVPPRGEAPEVSVPATIRRRNTPRRRISKVGDAGPEMIEMPVSSAARSAEIKGNT